MVPAKNVIETFRDVVQDLLVPELKAVKVSVDSLREDMKELRADIKQSNETMREEMKLRHDNLERMITYGDLRNEQLIKSLAEKFDVAVEIRERLATIEARMPRQ